MKGGIGDKGGAELLKQLRGEKGIKRVSFINVSCHERIAEKEEGNRGRRFLERFYKDQNFEGEQWDR